MFPLVRELAVDGVPVTVTCRVLKLCRQQYYRWIDEPGTDGQLDEAWLSNVIFDAHRDDPEFGCRFLADEVRLADHAVSDRVVEVRGRPRFRRSPRGGQARQPSMQAGTVLVGSAGRTLSTRIVCRQSSPKS